MKKIIKQAINSLGLDIKRIQRELPKAVPGSESRPIGNITMFLEDVRARGFKPQGIIDVGANHGDWTKMALSIFPESKVIMLEPQNEMVPFLERLCHQNSDIEFVHAGAGKEKGELVQTIWSDLAGSSFLVPVSDKETREQRKTPIITIDSLLSERKDFSPDLVKLDIQGFELEALRGATSIFGRTELFILETSLYDFMPNMPTTIDCFQFMHEKGYAIYDITEYLRRPFDGALGQIDIAFAKVSGHLRESNRWSPVQVAAVNADKPRG